MKKWINAGLQTLGYQLQRYKPDAPLSPERIGDLTDAQKRILETVRPFTLTSVERIIALLNAVDHVVRHQVPGDIVECGVWRGGSMMAVALALLAHGERSRSLYLYDTFEGMPPPTDTDVNRLEGTSAAEELRRAPKGTGTWCEAGLEDVRANLLSTGYPAERIHFVQGKVEDTLPATLPNPVALLRLDTDWYESTRHELRFLYPLVSRGGLVIIDDYGHWEGARKAVDEYFADQGPDFFLHRIDYTGRLIHKA